MQKNLYRIFFVVFLALCLVNCAGETNQGSADPVENASEEVFTSLYLNFGSGKEKTFENIPWKEGMTVWNVLVACEKQYGLQLEFKQYTGMGKFITALDGVQQVEDSDIYWRFCINNRTSTRGVEEQMVKQGQVVEFFWTKELPCMKPGEGPNNT